MNINEYNEPITTFGFADEHQARIARDGECRFDYQPCINRAAKKAVLGVADRQRPASMDAI
jgi:hypothetical protein